MARLEDSYRRATEVPRVLVVGDEFGTMEEVCSYLKRGGYLVTVARDGESAQEGLEPAPSVAIIDGHLPDMEGIDLIALLQMAAPSTPIILITAWPNPVLHGLKFAEPRPLEFAYEFARRLAPLSKRLGVEEIG